MRTIFKRIIKLGILFVILFLFVNYGLNNISEFEEIFKMFVSNSYVVLVLFVISLFSLFMNGFILNVLVLPFNIKLKPREYFGLSVVSNLYNLIFPFKGGSIIRAIYLKKNYSFSYSNFLSTLYAIYVLMFLVGSFVGLLSIVLIRIFYDIPTLNKVLYIILPLFLFTFGLIRFFPKFKESDNELFNKFIKILNGWHIIKDNKRIIYTTLIILFLQFIFGAVSIRLAYHAIGIDVPFLKALFITTMEFLSIIISLTPGNLGISESVNIFSAKILGIGLTEAIAVAVLVRLINTILVLLLGPVFSWFLLKGVNHPRLISKVNLYR